MKAHNKITHSIIGVTAGAALLLAAGCSKQEQPAGDTTKTMPPAAEAAKPAAAASQATAPTADSAQTAAAASPAAAPAAAEAQKAADAAQATTEPVPPAAAAAAQSAVDQAASQANATAAASTSQTQALIEKAKGLVTNEKYKDALAVVQQLASVKLTPEQQTLVDGLKTQIQTALAKSAAGDAASALGNILGGKK